MGSAITSTPQMQQTVPITFPSGVVGHMSPYPTVVIVIPAHQNVSGIDINLVPGSSFSAKYARDENIRTPIARNNISRPSSLYEFFNVKPSDCRPVECRASLRIRRMRMMRKTCTTRRTSWNWSVAFLFVSNKNRDTKYGSMANKSIIFKPPLKNFHLSGDALNLNMYSRVNHVMHTASTIASSGLSAGAPLCSCCNDGNVFKVKPIVDRIMNKIEITAITYKQAKERFFLSRMSLTTTSSVHKHLIHTNMKWCLHILLSYFNLFRRAWSSFYLFF